MRYGMTVLFLSIPLLAISKDIGSQEATAPTASDSAADSSRARPLPLYIPVQGIPQICDCIGRRLKIRRSEAFKPVRWSLHSLDGKPVRPSVRLGEELVSEFELNGFSKGHYLVKLDDISGRTFSRLIRID